MSLLSPTQRAVLRALDEDGIASTIAAPTAQDYVVFLKAPFALQIVGLQTQVTAGTLTANVKVGAVSVLGLSAVDVTVASLRTNPTISSPTTQVPEGELIAITVSAVVGAANFSYVLYYRRGN